MVKRASVSRSANSVSSETPSQDVPSFDQRVTQWMSTVIVSVGNSRNDFQFQLRKTWLPSSIVNSHCAGEMLGVGPADKTGKSVVRYCPGGSFASVVLRLPEKPRDIIAMCSSPCTSAGLWFIRQAAFLDHKFRYSLDAFTASHICKDKRTLRAHSLCI